MSIDRDIKYTHQSVGDYLQHRENRRVSKEIEEGVLDSHRQDVRKPKKENKSQPSVAGNERGSLTESVIEDRYRARESMIEGRNIIDCMADAEFRATINASYEDDGYGRHF